MSENKYFMNSSLSNHFYMSKFSIINIISVSVQFQYLDSFKLLFKYQFYWKQSFQFEFQFKLLEYHWNIMLEKSLQTDNTR